MGNDNIDVGKETPTRKPGQQQMTGAMSQQDSHVMGDNECAPQKLVRLVGCRDPQARLQAGMRGSDLKKRQF
ncbi:hypothetical protein [Bradyrhizobium cenepequi]|uniref:hypothetical protein n=1 Tax=Bradyrhizobium cenepequi TaxID=2821403 RepID=UPI001CE3A2D8|nr:hypothetical protein [Bradyrhizobium cenepequi]